MDDKAHILQNSSTYPFARADGRKWAQMGAQMANF
jgi:hypothetical protein